MWSDPNGTILVFWWLWSQQASGKFISNLESMINSISGQQDCWMQNGASKWYAFRFLWRIMQLVLWPTAPYTAVLWLQSLFWMPHVSWKSITLTNRDNELRFNGEYFQAAGSSKFGHHNTLGLGNYKNKALTTGCYSGSCGAKTELMNMETLEWSNGPDYPFAS